MSRARLGAFVGASLAAVGVAFSSANCKQPTEIVVDVRAEGVLCKGDRAIQQTGIAVSSYENVEREKLELFEGAGCDFPGDRIGTLTILPSGAEDAEVAFRIVAAIGKSAEQCREPWDNCIVVIRRERFTPGRSKTVTVILSGACVGKYCGRDKECQEGACVSSDGGTEEDGARPDGGPPPDAPEDSPINTNVDACSPTNCLGTCNAGKCDVDCNSALIDCTNKTVCGPGLDCTVNCVTTDAVRCTNVRCNTPTGTCTFNCENNSGSSNKGCRAIACSAQKCEVNCKNGGGNVCVGVYVDGGTNTVTCSDNAPDLQCDDVHCVTGPTGSCTRTCSPGNAVCGTNTSCAPATACQNWNDGG